MRYLGNKENIIPYIYSVLESKGIVGKSFFDFFSGTTSVAKFYKRKGYKVYTSDMMYFSYCLQKAYIENNETPTFKALCPIIGNATSRLFDSPLVSVLEYLDTIPLRDGFIFENYTPGGTSYLASPRMYFIDENGKKIDAIRQQIELWNSDGLLTDNEYFILLSCLIETVSFYANVSGVYAAFQKNVCLSFRYDDGAGPFLCNNLIYLWPEGAVHRDNHADTSFSAKKSGEAHSINPPPSTTSPS